MFVDILRQLQPVRGLPAWARYALATLVVLVCFGVRYALDIPEIGYPYPFLLFLPGIALSAFIFDRGTGFYATFLSGALALYFFIEPRHSFASQHLGQLLALGVFLVTGCLVAGLIEALRNTADDLAKTNLGLAEANDQLAAASEANRRAQEALRASEQRARLFIHCAPDKMWVNHPDGSVAYFNAAWRDYTGGSGSDETAGWIEAVHPEDRGTLLRARAEAIARAQAYDVQARIRQARDGAWRWHIGRVVPIRLEGRLIAWVGAATDIDDMRCAEAELREREQRLRLIVETARDYAIFTVDPSGRIVSWPPGAAEIFGYAPEEAIGQDFAILFTPEDRAAGAPQAERAEALREGSAPDQRWHMRKNGERFFMNGSTWLLRDSSGRDLGFLKMGRDETERRRSELLAGQAAERQAMITREVGHRVKNNLAIVSSLLSLQARNAQHPETRDALGDARARIEAIAQVHDQLWRQDQAERIDLDGFLSDLCARVQEAVPHHRIIYSGASVTVPIDRAVSISLLVNELITNAVKYAYPEGEGGPIRVSLNVLGPDRLRLEVADEGRGMPQAPDGATTDSGFGGKLLRTLSRQLGAELDIDTSHGTCIALVMPVCEESVA